MEVHRPLPQLSASVLVQSNANASVSGKWQKVLKLDEVWDCRAECGYVVRNGRDAVVAVFDKGGQRAYKNVLILDLGLPRGIEVSVSAVCRTGVNTQNNYARIAVLALDSVPDLSKLSDDFLYSADPELATQEGHRASVWSQTPAFIQFRAVKRYVMLNVFSAGNANPLVTAVVKVYI